MRYLPLILLLFASSALASGGTWTADDSSDGNDRFRSGCGHVTISGSWDSGTFKVLYYSTDIADWVTAKTFTDIPTDNPQVFDFGGVNRKVKVDLSSSTNPSVSWDIVEGDCDG